MHPIRKGTADGGTRQARIRLKSRVLTGDTGSNVALERTRKTVVELPFFRRISSTRSAESTPIAHLWTWTGLNGDNALYPDTHRDAGFR